MRHELWAVNERVRRRSAAGGHSLRQGMRHLRPIGEPQSSRSAGPDHLQMRHESTAENATARRAAGHEGQVITQSEPRDSTWSAGPHNRICTATCSHCQQQQAGAMARSEHVCGSLTAPTAVLCCCTLDSNIRIMLLTCGAKGTRTPDPLLANNRQHVHPRPSPQVSVPERPSESASVRTGCGTFLLYSAPHQSRSVRIPCHRAPCPNAASNLTSNQQRRVQVAWHQDVNHRALRCAATAPRQPRSQRPIWRPTWPDGALGCATMGR